MELLKELTKVHAPSGSEYNMTKFLIDYIEKNKNKFLVQPQLIYGEDFQDNLILVFGKPSTAIFAHIDSIGFTVGYNNQLIKIGKPHVESGIEVVGEDAKGPIACKIKTEEDEYQYLKIFAAYDRNIERGTTLTFKPNWIEDEDFVQCCYMDNRLGVWNALKVAETLENGIICFSCWEEHGGGSAEFLARYIYEKFKIKQALISDITWVTDGVKAGSGVAISMRDSGIPRRKYLNKIIDLAKQTKIPFQLEVESAGGSDGNAIQRTPYPIDWCFIGAAEQNVHSPTEKVHKKDIQSMVEMYKYLMKHL
ncbi:MAG: M42 family metallopeptidase [Vicingaceae bacterium]